MMQISGDFEPTVSRLGWTLVHSFWQDAIVAAILLVFLRIISNEKAHLRYIASCLAMLAILLGAIATYLLTGPTVHPVAAAALNSAMIKPIASNSQPLLISQAMADSPDHSLLLRYLVFAWIAGVFAFTLRHLLGWILLWPLRTGDRLPELEPAVLRLSHLLQIKRKIQLLQTFRINVPAVIGAFRPIVLLPVGILNDLNTQQIEAILLHELAHVARYDYLVNLMQAAVEALLFYHPAVWWISSQIRQEREHCCDDLACLHCNDTRLYAAALLALEERRWPVVLPALAATDGQLLIRVRRLLKLPATSLHRPVQSLAAAILVLACIGVPFVAVAQKPAAATTTTSSATMNQITPDDLKDDDDPYRIGPNDLIKLSVTGASVADTTKDLRVAIDGVITAGTSQIKIAGLTVEEAEKAIAKAHADDKTGEQRTVSITIAEARAQVFSALGQVAHPGQYAIPNGHFRLRDALKLVGGANENCSQILLVRTTPGQQEKRKLVIPLSRLNANFSDVNVVVRRDDLLLFALADVDPGQPASTQKSGPDSHEGEYYISGNVPRVGVYSLSNRKITLKQAVISAGGDDGTPIDLYLSVLRRDQDKESWPVVNYLYQDLLSGKQADVYLHANDIVRATIRPMDTTISAATRQSIVK